MLMVGLFGLVFGLFFFSIGFGLGVAVIGFRFVLILLEMLWNFIQTVLHLV
jgi:hypothetical protein